MSDPTTDPLVDEPVAPETAAAAGTAPAGGEPASAPLDDVERASRLTDLTEILDAIRPAVQADGGDLVLVDVDVEVGRVEVQLQGACSSCAVSSATLQAGVERILHDHLDWVTEVRGGVDDSIDELESAAMGRGGYVPRHEY